MILFTVTLKDGYYDSFPVVVPAGTTTDETVRRVKALAARKYPNRPVVKIVATRTEKTLWEAK